MTSLNILSKSSFIIVQENTKCLLHRDPDEKSELEIVPPLHFLYDRSPKESGSLQECRIVHKSVGSYKKVSDRTISARMIFCDLYIRSYFC